MDHWGDPWADDDVDAKSPTTLEQEEVKTPPPAIPTAPVLLNEFLDDAQWGSVEQEEEFGGWATSPKRTDAVDEEAKTRIQDGGHTSIVTGTPATNGHDRAVEREGFHLQNADWGGSEEAEDIYKEPDNVFLEASDSATTIQPDDNPDRISTEVEDALRPDDDLSTRPSTSPSDFSHTVATTESPRTSFEEEQQASRKGVDGETTNVHEEAGPVKDVGGPVAAFEPTKADGSDGDDFGDFEDNNKAPNDSSSETEAIPPELIESSRSEEIEEQARTEPHNDSIHPTPTTPTGIAGLAPDLSLIGQLFPAAKASEGLPVAPHDPIYSNSARKAWYRLTRKQTMRGFNSGGDDNNYIRISWANSRIRSDVTNTVSRWASEDRLAGRGPGGRASFLWDQPPNVQDPTSSSRLSKKSSISVSNPIRPAKQTTQPLATNVPAAFSWSSPSAAPQDPWKQGDSGVRAVSSPATIKPSPLSGVQHSGSRQVSVDLTPRQKPHANHRKTVSHTSSFHPEETATVLPTTNNHPIEDEGNADPWGDLSSLDTTLAPNSTENLAEDDDDWGEMVVSPTTSAVDPVQELSQTPSQQKPSSTPVSTPKTARTSPSHPAPSKHASPLVRLKGTVSPTSALFGVNSLVPTGIEDGPIGPGRLKPARKSPQATPEKPHARSTTISSLNEVLGEQTEVPASKADEADEANDDDDFSAFESSISQTSTPAQKPEDMSTFEPSTPTLSPSPNPLPPTTPTSTDPWSDADFSFFESSTHPPSSNTTTTHTYDPADPFSVFNTPAPAPFHRSPPRPKTPPPKMGLTGASNSAQRRKAEEDDVITSIVDGLPDLGYMLRR